MLLKARKIVDMLAITEMTHRPSLATVQPLIVSDKNFDEALQATSLFFKLACRIVLRMRYGSVIFQLPDGRRLKFTGDVEPHQSGVIIIRNFNFAPACHFQRRYWFF